MSSESRGRGYPCRRSRRDGRSPEQPETVMKRSDVSFAELRELLLELGFHETVEKARLVFTHPVGGTLLFRRYRSNERVTLGDMLVVREQLEYNGVLDSAELDRLLHKTPA